MHFSGVAMRGANTSDAELVWTCVVCSYFSISVLVHDVAILRIMASSMVRFLAV